MWEALQLEMERRKAYSEKYNINKLDYAAADNPFAGMVICGQCGSTFGRKVWNSTDEIHRRVIWRCNKKYEIKGKKSCENKHIDDRVLYQAFINAMIENKDYFLEKWKNRLQSDNALVRCRAKQFMKIFERAEKIKEFDVYLYFKIIEKMTAVIGEKIFVTLLDVTEVEVLIE